jgi:hypothetical protein
VRAEHLEVVGRSLQKNNIPSGIHIKGFVRDQIILHSNVPNLHFHPQRDVVSVLFHYSGKFEAVRFRVTSSIPEEDFLDTILYPSETEQHICLQVSGFKKGEVLTIDFNIFGFNIEFRLSDIKFENASYNEEHFIPEPIKKYKSKALLRDWDMLNAPEPHS